MWSGGCQGCPSAWQCCGEGDGSAVGRVMAAPAPGPAQPAREPQAVLPQPPASSQRLTGVGWDPISGGPGVSPWPLRAARSGRAPVLGGRHWHRQLPGAAVLLQQPFGRDHPHRCPQAPSLCSSCRRQPPHSPCAPSPQPSTGITGIGAVLLGLHPGSPHSPLPHRPVLELAPLHKTKAMAMPRGAEHHLLHPPIPMLLQRRPGRSWVSHCGPRPSHILTRQPSVTGSTGSSPTAHLMGKEAQVQAGQITCCNAPASETELPAPPPHPAQCRVTSTTTSEIGPSLDTGCSICNSMGRSQHPRLTLGSTRRQGGSWLRSLPAPKSIQGKTRSSEKAKNHRLQEMDPCCVGRGWGAHLG